MGKTRPYQRCSQCVMDTSDSKIVFDENGVCDHCRNFEKKIKPYWKRKIGLVHKAFLHLMMQKRRKSLCMLC